MRFIRNWLKKIIIESILETDRPAINIKVEQSPLSEKEICISLNHCRIGPLDLQSRKSALRIHPTKEE
jgi:hypothetical protein